MDKRVIFAVAGSGKTTFILNRLNLEKRALIITYTVRNYLNLRNGIINRFGYIPTNIKIETYYPFLYGFCYKPHLAYQFDAKGINWNSNPNRYCKSSDTNYYLDRKKYLFSNRIALMLSKHGIMSLVKNRLEKYYDEMYIDEIQDFGGHDFNFLKGIASAQIDLLFVGDFYQHTYDTSHDGSVNKSLHDNYLNYQSQFRAMGITVDTITLSKSYRCPQSICNFITQNLGINIESHRTESNLIQRLDARADAIEIYQDNDIVKLFYSERNKFNCYGSNWGESKGEDKYTDVCVVLNKTSWKKFQEGDLSNLPGRTKNKLYVALSRTKRNLYLVPDMHFKSFKRS